MKSKLEDRIDKELERMNVSTRLYHITDVVGMARAITIAVDGSWKGIDVPALVLQVVEYCRNQNDLLGFRFFPRLTAQLHAEGLSGISICDRRDAFSRKRGRIIAKGRLLKHLKED